MRGDRALVGAISHRGVSDSAPVFFSLPFAFTSCSSSLIVPVHVPSLSPVRFARLPFLPSVDEVLTANVARRFGPDFGEGAGTVRAMNRFGPRSDFTCAQLRGMEAVAPDRARGDSGATAVGPAFLP